MISPEEKLYVFHDTGSFIDLSQDAADLIRDNFALTLAPTDYLYLGYFKPFSAAYAELVVPDTQLGTLRFEYYNGATWQALQVSDDTKSLKRSGFLTWDKSLMMSTVVDGQAGYFIRAQISVETDEMTVRGINLVFADDTDLKRDFFEVTNSNILPPGELSHIVHHVAARNYIVQRLKNLGYIKYDTTNRLVSMTYWDLHEIAEVKQAAVQLALSKIFFNLSDRPEDTWWAKYREYQDNFENAFKSIVRLSFDVNDDGVKNEDENLKVKQVTRWVR